MRHELLRSTAGDLRREACALMGALLEETCLMSSRALHELLRSTAGDMSSRAARSGAGRQTRGVCFREAKLRIMLVTRCMS